MRKEVLTDIKQRYAKVKEELCNTSNYPHINKLLNLPAFIKENDALYSKLLTELKELRRYHEGVQKRQMKIKTTPFYLSNLVNSATVSQQDDDTLGDIRNKNQILRDNINKLKEERNKKMEVLVPLIKDKQKVLKEKKEELQKLTEANLSLKRAIEEQELLQLYEMKCRECQSLRIVNNQLSEQLKQVITNTNKVTGSEQNPNMFLLSLGIH